MHYFHAYFCVILTSCLLAVNGFFTVYPSGHVATWGAVLENVGPIAFNVTGPIAIGLFSFNHAIQNQRSVFVWP
jgi:hypothetical protein